MNFSNLFGYREESHNGISFVRNNELFGNWESVCVEQFLDSLYPEEREGLKAFIADGGVLLFDDTAVKMVRACFTMGTDDKGVVKPTIVVTQKAIGHKAVMEHELTHYRQYKRGDLTFNGEGFDFKGERMGSPYNFFVFFGEVEREARQAQSVLIAKHQKIPARLFELKITASLFLGI